LHPNSNSLAGAIDSALAALGRECLTLEAVAVYRRIVEPDGGESPPIVEVLVSDERLRHLVFQARRYENDARWAVLRHNPGPWEGVVESLASRLPRLEQEIQAVRSEIERLTDRKLELERELLFCPVEQLASKRAALTALHVQLDEQARRLKEVRNGRLAEEAGRGR
jgi:hypothetical protein